MHVSVPLEATPNHTPPHAIQVMKFHACLNVSNLEKSLVFYSALLGAPPVKVYDNYAKFAIDTSGRRSFCCSWEPIKPRRTP